jgi:hypothetical protein
MAVPQSRKHVLDEVKYKLEKEPLTKMHFMTRFSIPLSNISRDITLKRTSPDDSLERRSRCGGFGSRYPPEGRKEPKQEMYEPPTGRSILVPILSNYGSNNGTN